MYLCRQMQEVELGRLIRLLDSPGVVLANSAQLDPSEYALKNAVRIETLADPVQPVLAILRRCSRDMVRAHACDNIHHTQLMLQYNIAEFKDADEFLALIALKIGVLKKGARPDINAAAKRVRARSCTCMLSFVGVARLE